MKLGRVVGTVVASRKDEKLSKEIVAAEALARAGVQRAAAAGRHGRADRARGGRGRRGRLQVRRRAVKHGERRGQVRVAVARERQRAVRVRQRAEAAVRAALHAHALAFCGEHWRLRALRRAAPPRS